MAHRTLIVHATNLLVRGFLAAPTDRRSDAGLPTNALFALTRALRRVMAFKQPDFAVAVVDTSLPVDTCAPLLREQIAPLGALLERHGLPIVNVSRAVDTVASYAQAALDLQHDVVVIGSDKRLAQLVSDRLWWYDAYKDVRYTPELVGKRFEVPPEHVAGWLALVGDDDTLPGVKGIGKKGATGLVHTYGSITVAMQQADDVPGRTGKALRASLDVAHREMARARLDVLPLGRPIEQLPFQAPEVSALNALYGELGFYSLLATDDASAAPSVVIVDTHELAEKTLVAFGVEPVAMHALIAGPSPARGKLVGLALCQAEGDAFYFPFAGRGRCLEGPAVLASWLSDASCAKIGHDVKTAVVALARSGIEMRGVVGDSACASHLADPSGMAPHDLPGVARQRLRRAVDDEDVIRGVGRKRKQWSDLSVEVAGAYAGLMADVAAALWRDFEPALERDEPQRGLLTEYLELSDVLVGMELSGFACDSDDLAGVGADFEAIEGELGRQIFAHAGRTFNLGSTKQLGSVLFEDLGLPIVKRTKTGWSTATDALERIENAHVIVPLVIRWRRLRRLRDSWVTALRAAIDADGRVRSMFHPARSFSGRLVNSHPDLGRVPGRTPEMARIRHAFRTATGRTLLSVDYQQLGLFVLAHLTQDPALVEPLRRGDDMHTLTAAAVLDLNVSDVGPDERQLGKVVNFATFAGQGASALALQLGVTSAEAKEIVLRFDQRYAVARRFQDEQLRLAKERGYVETIAGRRWPIGQLASLDPQTLGYAERLARRATHEGSVADVTRRGLLRAAQALRAAGLQAFPLLQIHDEVLFEVPDAQVAKTARAAAGAMVGAFDLVVPLRVSCKIGPNWSALAPYETPES